MLKVIQKENRDIYKLLAYPEDRIVPIVVGDFATYEEAHQEALECIRDKTTTVRPAPKNAKSLSSLEIVKVSTNKNGSSTREIVFLWEKED